MSDVLIRIDQMLYAHGEIAASSCLAMQSSVKPAEALVRARQWPSYFQLPVLMLMLITLLNDGTLISIGYDRAVASARPERWNLRQIFTMASVLGLVACLSSLLLLGACLDAGRPGSAFARLGLPAIEYGKIITLIYLKARPRPAPAHVRVGKARVRLGSPYPHARSLCSAYPGMVRSWHPCGCTLCAAEAVPGEACDVWPLSGVTALVA